MLWHALAAAGVRHSYLWLADSLGRPFTISLRHPGIRLRALAARGELSTARTIAQRGADATAARPLGSMLRFCSLLFCAFHKRNRRGFFPALCAAPPRRVCLASCQNTLVATHTACAAYGDAHAHMGSLARLSDPAPRPWLTLAPPRVCVQRSPRAGLQPSFHDDVARFLAAMSPTDGVREALLLPGLTPAAEMALAIRYCSGAAASAATAAAAVVSCS